MPQVDEIEALRRAKQNCERDGCIWDASVLVTVKHELPNRPALNRKTRAQYLARARRELLEEQGKRVR
ncbi:hypothetical protein SAMN05444161_3123 [Rhizobiales bacterium GAS191]|nr:hypothetical protein SAMN05444161_3123 [Rhizobiales bacterium GAS191]